MKNQPEFITKMQEKVEEIRLAQEEVSQKVELAEKPKAMGYRNAYNKLEDAFVSITAQAKLRDDQKVMGIIQKMQALNKELYGHLNATYSW